MKLKSQPADFVVEELAPLDPGAEGRFALYRLSKRSLGTPEVIQAIRRRWNIPPHQVSYAGLKDRHAETTQYITIERGPRRDLKQSSFACRYLGQVARPFAADQMLGNRFRITLRAFSRAEVERAAAALGEVERDGLPNYFDDQRFGSVGPSREFIVQAWLRGDHERALWLALAEASPSDRSGERAEKRTLREHWGQWAACKAALPQSSRRSIVTYLADHPSDFRGAFARLRADLKGIYLSAFQSYLWNHLLDRLVTERTRPEQRLHVPLKLGPLSMFRNLKEDQRAALDTIELPLPSARQPLGTIAEPLRGFLEQTVRELGVEWRELRVKHLPGSFFSKGWRKATYQPAALNFEHGPDELNPGEYKLLLNFELPKGSYATVLIKRITVGAQ